MPDFHIKEGDTLPALEGTLLKPDKTPQPVDAVPLGNIKFNMRDASGELVVDHGDVQIIDGPNGIVQYNWQVGDTDTPGTYQCEFEVDFGGGQIETYPNSKNKKVIIFPQIA